MKSNNLSIITVIFNFLILSSATYRGCVWSWLENFEKIYLMVFAKNLHLPINTPNYAARLEVALRAISVSIFASCIDSHCKLNEMPMYRLPEMCLLRLLSVVKSVDIAGQYNWCTQIFRLFLGMDVNILDDSFD